MAAIAQFPSMPAIYCWHGARPWIEHPPIRILVVTSERIGPRLVTETGMPEDRVVTIPNFVDLERFSRIRQTLIARRARSFMGRLPVVVL